MVFLRRYIKFRGICQETYYNVARVLHQLSLFDLAVNYYKKCLQSSCVFEEQKVYIIYIKKKKTKKLIIFLFFKKEIYDLSKYAAYNLISIYKHSGSYVLARQIMNDYLTI